MPWAQNKPDPSKYRTPEHKAIRKQYAQQMARNGYLVCAQPVCVMPSRIILPGMPWHVGHDETGTRYIGPVCKRCNMVDAAMRGNRSARRGKPRRWVL